MEGGIVAKAILKRKQNRGFIRAKKKRHNSVGALQKKRVHLSFPLHCSQRKQLLWKFCLSAISDSMGYTLFRHTLHSSDSGTGIFCKNKNKR